jgi:hypothetical protein
MSIAWLQLRPAKKALKRSDDRFIAGHAMRLDGTRVAFVFQTN